MEFNFYDDSKDDIDIKCNDEVTITDSHNNIGGVDSCRFDIHQYEYSISDSIPSFGDKQYYDENPNDPSKLNLVLFNRRFDAYY